MAVAFLMNPVITISRFQYIHPRNRVLSENLGFSNNKDSVNAKSRFLKSPHKCGFGISSFGAKSTSGISFNIKYTIGLGQKVALNIGGQNVALNIGGCDATYGSGGGGPGGLGNGGGGWTDTNDDNGGVRGSVDWEKVKGCCWWLLDTWKYHYELAHPNSPSVLLFSKFVMPIVEELVGYGAQDLEGLLMRLLMAIFYPMVVLTPIVFYGCAAAMEQMLLLLATGVLGFVLVALFLFAKFYLHML